MKKNIKLLLFSILISFFTTISAQTLINGNFESGGNGVGFLINGEEYDMCGGNKETKINKSV